MKSKFNYIKKETFYTMIIIIFYCIGLFFYAWYRTETSGKSLEGFNYQAPLILSGILLLSGSCFIVWLIYEKKSEIHHIYMAMSIIIFTLFLWVQPPGHVHDIQFHYDSTYVLSNKILKQDTEELTMGKGGLHSYYRRKSDSFLPYTSFENFINYYADSQENLLKYPRTEEISLVENDTWQGTISVPLYFYFPQALGFSIARLLKLNMFWMLLLGRVFICMASVYLNYRAIKNTPIGKEILLICGLIPTTLLSYGTFSRDALILAFSFYFTGKCLQLTYSNRKIPWWEYGVLFLSLLILIPNKVVYVGFVVLLGLPFCKRYKRGNWNKRHLVTIVVVISSMLLIFGLLNLEFFKFYLWKKGSGIITENSPFTIPYILSNLGLTVKVILKTLSTSTVRYFANMIAIGDYGGGIHKEMVVVAVVLILLIMLGMEKSKVKISLKERGIMAATWIMISLTIVLGYLLYTPHNNDVIIGVQGRYFTPVLPLMILSFCCIMPEKISSCRIWENITDFMNKRIVRGTILMGMYCLALFVVVNMYAWIVAG